MWQIPAADGVEGSWTERLQPIGDGAGHGCQHPAPCWNTTSPHPSVLALLAQGSARTCGAATRQECV